MSYTGLAGWGRGTWSEDAWNTPGGYILTGNGSLFSIKGFRNRHI